MDLEFTPYFPANNVAWDNFETVNEQLITQLNTIPFGLCMESVISLKT